MAIEDFTTFNSINTAIQAGTIAIAQTRNTFTTMQNDDDSAGWVGDDKGADYFGSTFTHSFEFNINGIVGNWGTHFVWGVSNVTSNNWRLDNLEAVGVRFAWDEGASKIVLEDTETDTSDTFASAQTDLLYYCTVERTALNSITCKIYTDAAKSLTSDALTIALSNMRNYQYGFGLMGIDQENNAYSLSGYTQNLDFAAGEIAPSSARRRMFIMG